MAGASEVRVSERDRDEVRRVAAQLAGESTAVVHVLVPSVTYRVPGRRADGTRRGTENVKWAAGKARLALWVLLHIPVLLIAAVLDGNPSFDVPPRNKDKMTVRGKDSCGALSFADAVREAARGSVWLAWSRSQVALLTANRDHEPRVVWRGTGDERPKLKIARANLRWPDGSSVDFGLDQAERTRVTEHDGTP